MTDKDAPEKPETPGMAEVSAEFVAEAEAATATPPSSASVPDDPLIALGEQWKEAYDNWLEFDTDGASNEEVKALEERKSELGDIAWRIEDQAADIPARSIAGVLAQLRMAGEHYYLMERDGTKKQEWANTYAHLTWQAWEGLERLAGEAVPIGEASVMIDDPLLALERRMLAVEAVIDEPGQEAPKSVHREWWSLQDQVAGMPAISIAGIAVKLRLMRANTEYLDAHEFGDKLIQSAIESAERLAGGGATTIGATSPLLSRISNMETPIIVAEGAIKALVQLIETGADNEGIVYLVGQLQQHIEGERRLFDDLFVAAGGPVA